MKARLIIFKLKIKSSYNQNVEQPADNDVFDTLQFFIQDKSIFRIKTFAIDHDIHIHSVNLRDKTIVEMIDMLITSTKDHYGELIDKKVFLDIENLKDDKEIKALLTKEGLSPNIDTTPDFIFWNPDNKKYHSQSKPL